MQQIKPAGPTAFFKGKRRYTPYVLQVGKYYSIRSGFGRGKVQHVQFIRATNKGYNFLSLSENRVIFNFPLYRSKYERYASEPVFFLPNWLYVYECDTLAPNSAIDFLATHTPTFTEYDHNWNLIHGDWRDYTDEQKQQRTDLIRSKACERVARIPRSRWWRQYSEPKFVNPDIKIII